MPDGRVQLAFGHRRRRGFDRLAVEDAARWGAIPVIIRALDDESMARQAWKENRDRRDLTAFEESTSIARNMRIFGWSQKTAAEKLGLDVSTISNKLRLLKLPPTALALLERGELSERQAVALLPLVELPASAFDRVPGQLVYMHGSWRGTLDEVIAGAAKLPADGIREHVSTVLSKLTVALDDQPWAKELWGNLPGAHCATCKDCELRLKSANRCPDLACAELKRNAALRLQAAAAAEVAKLPPVAIGRYGSYDNLSEVAINPLRAEAKRRQCGNLGVAVATGGAYLPKKIEGHPTCGIVCAHGERGRCACRAAGVVTKGPDSAAAQKKADKKEIKDRYKEPAERAIADALAILPAGTARMLLRHISGSTAQKLAAAPAAQICEAIAAAIVKEEIKYSYDYAVKLEEAKKALTTLLETAKIARPWEDTAPAAPPAPAWPAALVGQIREQISVARELAELPIAGAYLAEARRLLGTMPTASASYPELRREIDAAAAEIAAGQAGQVEQPASAASLPNGWSWHSDGPDYQARRYDGLQTALYKPVDGTPRQRAITDAIRDESHWPPFAGAIEWSQMVIRAAVCGAELHIRPHYFGGYAAELMVGDRIIGEGDWAAITATIEAAERKRAKSKSADLRANVPDLPVNGVPIVPFATILIWLDELEQRIAAGTAAEADLELLADHLELLADDESVGDGEFEAAQIRLDGLADRIAAPQREAA
jgi:ParB/RepB/Spo0J family partition protein